MPDPESADTGGDITPKPDHVPDKFYDAETGTVDVSGMGKSYVDLETRLTKATTKKKPQGVAIPPEGGDGDQLPDDATLDTVLQKAGVEKADIARAFVEDGKATDQQYEALKKLGYPKGVVDEVLGQQVYLEMGKMGDAKKQAAELCGGEAELDNLLTFGKSLTPEAQEWFNQQAKDSKTMLHAVKWLLQEHRTAVGAGKATPLIEGEGGEPGGAGPFKSRLEVTTMQQDPRMKTDSAFQALYDARLTATKGAIEDLPPQ